MAGLQGTGYEETENVGESHNAKTCQAVADGKENPFWTLEAAQEHIGMLWGWYARQGYEPPRLEKGQKVDNKIVGDFSHELIVVERYLYKAFDMFSALNPLLYAASDGDETALKLLRDHLMALKEKHQRDWDEFEQNLNS
jgi:hypothetical protein